jgi:hypothetical protein
MVLPSHKDNSPSIYVRAQDARSAPRICGRQSRKVSPAGSTWLLQSRTTPRGASRNPPVAAADVTPRAFPTALPERILGGRWSPPCESRSRSSLRSLSGWGPARCGHITGEEVITVAMEVHIPGTTATITTITFTEHGSAARRPSTPGRIPTRFHHLITSTRAIGYRTTSLPPCTWSDSQGLRPRECATSTVRTGACTTRVCGSAPADGCGCSSSSGRPHGLVATHLVRRAHASRSAEFERVSDRERSARESQSKKGPGRVFSRVRATIHVPSRKRRTGDAPMVPSASAPPMCIRHAGQQLTFGAALPMRMWQIRAKRQRRLRTIRL